MEQRLVTERILATRNVVLARDGKPFARLPDLDVGSGESIAIIGPSGCGKTTALMAIAGIRAPQNGTITIEESNPWKLGRRARDGFRGRRVGLVFQSFHLVDALSVRANVQLAAQCAGYPVHEPDRMQLLLRHLGLESIQSQRADRISHGQAQRTAIARALLNRPAIILADEPTSALDDASTEAIMTLLTESAVAEKAALVVATHDRRVLAAVDTVVEMEALP